MLTLKIIHLIGIGVALLGLGLILGRQRRAREGDSFWMRVFKDNRDLDSTLDRVILAAIILFSLVAFHDDLTNIQTAGIVLALFNSLFAVYQSIVTGKAVKDLGQAMQQNGTGGQDAGKTQTGTNH